MIQCKDYDYIELACLYSMHVELHFDTFSVSGIAKDTQYNEKRQHGIILLLNNESTWYPLDSLLAMTAHTTNSYFQHLEFTH